MISHYYGKFSKCNLSTVHIIKSLLPSCQRPNNYYKNTGNLLNHLSNQLSADLYRPKATLIKWCPSHFRATNLTVGKNLCFRTWRKTPVAKICRCWEKNETISSTESMDKHYPKKRSVMCALEIWLPRAKNPGFYRDNAIKKKWSVRAQCSLYNTNKTQVLQHFSRRYWTAYSLFDEYFRKLQNLNKQLHDL